MTGRYERPTRGRGLGRRAARLGLALVSVGVAGCGGLPTPTTSGPTVPAATHSPADGVPITVRFAGRIGCARFPYSCMATLSVLDGGVDITDAWRPESNDPWWATAHDSAEIFDTGPNGRPPVATAGPHRLVVSLLGSYDTPSYAPDGSQAFDLLGRCATDVEIAPAVELDVLVTFTPDPASFRASCTIVVG